MDTDHVGLEEILELMQHNWLKEFELLVFKGIMIQICYSLIILLPIS